MRFPVKTSIGRVCQAGLMAVFVGFPLLLAAQGPSWWHIRGVIDAERTPDDYAAANQGQAKFIAVKAYEELEDRLPGGAGEALADLHASLVSSVETSDGYQAINAGQLKNLAKPFYDRLIEAGYTAAYPWEGGANADDYALVNVGQVKNLFSFDLSIDSENEGLGDGLPDWWEMAKFGNLDQTAEGDPDGDHISNLEEFEGASDPTDYFEDKTVTISATLDQYVSYQSVAGSVVRLNVKVWQDNGPTRNIMTNTPVKIEVLDSDGGFRFTESGTADLYTTLTGRTDSAGELLVFAENSSPEGLFFQQPPQDNVTTHIRIQALGKTVVAELTLEAKTLAGTPYEISATRLEDGTNYVAWVSQGNSEDSDIEGYVLERSSDGVNWGELAELDTYAENYVDEGLEENETYHYRLRSFHYNGELGRVLGSPLFTSPNEFAANGDADGDGILNAAEASQGTNPAVPTPSGQEPPPQEESEVALPPASYALIQLPKPSGEDFVFAGETNSSGVTSGISYRYTSEGMTSAVLLRWVNGAVENLGEMETIPFSVNVVAEPNHYWIVRTGGVYFTKINEAGSILCYNSLWKNGTFHPLAQATEVNAPYDLNNSDQIVGYTIPAEGPDGGSFILPDAPDQMVNTVWQESIFSRIFESINNTGKTYSSGRGATYVGGAGNIAGLGLSELTDSDEMLGDWYFYGSPSSFYYPRLAHFAQGYGEYLPLPKNFKVSSSYPKCLNNLGNAVISYQTSGGQKTALWVKGKPGEGYSIQDLSYLIPAGSTFTPTHINDQNVITGNLVSATDEYTPVVLVPAEIKIAKSPSTDADYVADNNGGYIPINANNDNGSAFKTVNNYSTHFPMVRDYDATNLPKDDGELIHLRTELPVGTGAAWQAQLVVQNNGRARVKFWRDRRKQNEFIVGTPVASSSFPKDLYVEGIVPGAAEKEIVLKLQIIVNGQASNANSIKLTVTPILTDFQALTLNHTSPFFYTAIGSYLASGNNPNIAIVADMMRKNVAGQPEQIQDLAIVNHNGKAVTVYPGDPTTTTASRTYVYQFASPGTGLNLVDISEISDFPFYKAQTSYTPDGDNFKMSIKDNPLLSISPILPSGSEVAVVDLTWSFKNYSIWVYPDGSAYPLGRTTWDIRWAGKITAGPSSSYLWVPAGNNANNVGQSWQLNNQEPNIHLPTALHGLSDNGGGFQ